MTTLREAAKLALEALEYGHFAVADQSPHAGVMAYLEATNTLRTALEYPSEGAHMLNEEENAVLLIAGFTQREINTQKRKFYNLFRVEPWLVPMDRKQEPPLQEKNG